MFIDGGQLTAGKHDELQSRREKTMTASVQGQPQKPCDGHQSAVQRTSCLTCLDFKVCFGPVACCLLAGGVSMWLLVLVVVDVAFVSWRLFLCWAMSCFRCWCFC